MEDENETSFTFVLDNLWEKKVTLPKFLSGGLEWCVVVRPKKADGYFDINLEVWDPDSLRPGLVRRVSFSMVLLYQSGKGIFRSEFCSIFCDKVPSCGVSGPLPISDSETNKLILKLELEKVVEVVDWNEMVDFNGFQIHYSQIQSVDSLYTKHPDFAINFSLTEQLVKTRYMNLLLALIHTLNKPPHSLTDTELSNARSDLDDLTQVGFKLNWLKILLAKRKEKLDSLNRNIDIEKHINDKFKLATHWLQGVVHSWKTSLGFALLRNEKID